MMPGCGCSAARRGKHPSRPPRRLAELGFRSRLKQAKLTAAAAATGCLLRPGATEAQIQDAEWGVGRALPPSYREFLLVSDGAHGDCLGPTTVEEEPEYPPGEVDEIGVAFLPVGHVQAVSEGANAFRWVGREIRG